MDSNEILKLINESAENKRQYVKNWLNMLGANSALIDNSTSLVFGDSAPLLRASIKNIPAEDYVRAMNELKSEAYFTFSAHSNYVIGGHDWEVALHGANDRGTFKDFDGNTVLTRTLIPISKKLCGGLNIKSPCPISDMLAHINKSSKNKIAYIKAWYKVAEVNESLPWVTFKSCGKADADKLCLAMQRYNGTFVKALRNSSIPSVVECEAFLTCDTDSPFHIGTNEWKIARNSLNITEEEEDLYLCSMIPICTDVFNEAFNTLPINKITDETPSNEPVKQPKSENKMKESVTKVVDTNKSAALLTAQIGVGQAANKSVSKLIKKQLPVMVRGYAEEPIGKLVIANLVNFAVQQYAGENKKAVTVADAMVQSAMLDMLNQLDVEELVEKFLDEVPSGKLDNLLKAKENAE